MSRGEIVILDRDGLKASANGTYHEPEALSIESDNLSKAMLDKVAVLAGLVGGFENLANLEAPQAPGGLKQSQGRVGQGPEEFIFEKV